MGLEIMRMHREPGCGTEDDFWETVDVLTGWRTNCASWVDNMRMGRPSEIAVIEKSWKGGQRDAHPSFFPLQPQMVTGCPRGIAVTGDFHYDR